MLLELGMSQTDMSYTRSAIMQCLPIDCFSFVLFSFVFLVLVLALVVVVVVVVVAV